MKKYPLCARYLLVTEKIMVGQNYAHLARKTNVEHVIISNIMYAVYYNR